ncbi:glycosyltransferase [Exiguobacterium sp. Leaf196]|uniref:glycosyltransferase n=1 Tax=Exiguobacterium sp. Leaf196 TaxID=1736298 RepID=UPI0006FB45DC|nr:glycosyltransferase [Exiguobacterium sp. Leaf196]KQS44681.1 glycosyl transferase family 1 [Exiguobacterium sp. Leaf196]
MKRIGMFVWNPFTNDARVLRECTALAEAGHCVDLYCLNDGTLPEVEFPMPGFRVIRIDRTPPFARWLPFFRKQKKRTLAIGVIGALLAPWLIPVMIVLFLLMRSRFIRYALYNSFGILRMTRAARKHNYDVMHANDVNTLPQAIGAARGTKIVYDSHEVQTDRTGYGSMQGKLERWLLHFVDQTIVENDTRADYHQKLYGTRPSVLHNYPFYESDVPQPRPLREELALASDEPILLYQGGIQEGRGLERLIEAMPFIDRGTLIFVGDGKLKEKLMQLAAQSSEKSRIRFIEKVPLAELPSYTAAATVGFQVLQNVCFNHYSASSNKLFEYMAALIPVVAADLPEIRRVVETEGIGLIVDVESPHSIAEAVNRLVKDKSLRGVMQERASVARRQYNWEQEKGRLLAVYDSIFMESGTK